MGDRDFTEGDPWGLPIEETEEYDGGIPAPVEPTEVVEEAPVPLESDASDTEQPPAEVTGSPDHDDTWDEPSPEPDAVAEEPAWSDRDGLEDRPEEEQAAPAADEEGAVAPDEPGEGASEEDGYTFKAPSRTPLSQMIAAAQSVVSSVQGEPAEEEEAPAPQPVVEETPAPPPSSEDLVTEDVQRAEPATPSEEDDLPAEPPAWLVGDRPAEPSVPEAAEPSGGAETYSAEEIEASLAGLAATEPTHEEYAEDRFDTDVSPEPEPETGLEAVDFESSPGVFSELHDLADQDAQAEAMLQEAAQAFAPPTEPESGLDDDAFLDETLPEDTTDLEQLTEALATDLTDTTLEPIEDTTTEETLPEDTTDLEQLTEALVPAVDAESDAAPAPGDYLSEMEFDEAVARLDEAGADDGTAEAEPDWWGESPEPELVDEAGVGEDQVEAAPEETRDALEISIPEGEEDEARDEPSPAASQDEPPDEEAPEEEAGVAPEELPPIDSPVEWGTRYREAHQGWVEDDEGRSTWRPIVTTGELVAGWDIDIYLGLVSGDVAVDSSPDAMIDDVAGARNGAVRRMLDEALARGAHAVVGVSFSVQDVSDRVLVSASGVAVTLRTPA